MADDLKLIADDYMPLRDVVFKTLRQAILKGDMQPGERLMEIQLANKLGVSRTPIREAMRKLELEGLVVMTPRKGAEVAGITEKNLRDVLEVRKALEELAIEITCKKINEDEIEELSKAEVAFRAAVEKGDVMQIAQMDEGFHDIIFKATGNDRLMQMLGNLREQMYRFRLEYIKDLDKRKLLVEEHKKILDSIAQKNAKEAKRAIAEHIDNQQITVSKTIKEN